MFTFEGKCPHCCSDRGFVAFGMSDYLIGDYDYQNVPPHDRRILEQRRENNPLTLFSLAGNCLTCKTPVVATCRGSMNARNEIQRCIGSFDISTRHKVAVENIFPKPIAHYSHASLPKEVNESFIDLQAMVQEGKRPHFIIMGCRAVLEAAVRTLGGEGKSLWERVDDLFRKGVITVSLKEWATIIRQTGNDAAHEMKGTTQEAGELVQFTRVFLQFTFELPDTIAKIRSDHA